MSLYRRALFFQNKKMLMQAQLIRPYISDEEKYAPDEYYGVIFGCTKSTSTLKWSIAYLKTVLAAFFLCL
jgi:hypothetical protein